MVTGCSKLNKQQVKVTLMPQCGLFYMLFKLISAWQAHYINLYDRAVQKGKDFVKSCQKVLQQ